LGVTAAVAAAVLASLATGDPALAKWSSAHAAPGAEVATVAAKVQLLTKEASGQEAVFDAVAEGDQQLTVPFGPADAAEVAALSASAGGSTVYWTKLYELRGEVSGTIGFTYSGQPVGQFAPGTYQENLVLFPVDDESDCSSAEVQANWGRLPGQGNSSYDLGMPTDREPGTGYAVTKTYSQLYCLATRFGPLRLENTATAEGKSAAGATARAEDYWWANQYPDTAAEPKTGFTFDVEFEYVP
jgi:hypothetical protein